MFVPLTLSENRSPEETFILFHRKLFKVFVEENNPPVKHKRCKDPKHSSNTKGVCWICGGKKKPVVKAKSKFSNNETIVAGFGDAIVMYSLGVIDGSDWALQNFLGKYSLFSLISEGFEVSPFVLNQYELLAQICVLSPKTDLYREIKRQLLNMHSSFNDEIVKLLEKEYEVYKKEKQKQ